MVLSLIELSGSKPHIHSRKRSHFFCALAAGLVVAAALAGAAWTGAALAGAAVVVAFGASLAASVWA